MMKIVKLLLFGVFLLSSQLLFSQNFGIKGGLLINQIKLKNSVPLFVPSQPKPAAGFTLGIMYQKQLHKYFAIKTELGYSKKGAKDITAFTTDFEYKLHYLDLGIMGMFKIANDISIDIGVEPSYLLKGNLTVQNEFDLGLIGGVSYFFGEKIEISGRYYFGLNPVVELSFTDDAGNDIGTYGYFNRNIEVSIGYYFRAKKTEN